MTPYRSVDTAVGQSVNQNADSFSPHLKAARSLVIFCALASAPALAHEDSIVKIAGDGSLKGLPAQYEPATLVVDAMLFQLRLGRNEVALPPCLTAHLGLAKGKLDAYASWYHEHSVLPPYIGFHVVHGARQRSFFNGFSLLFNLETGSLIGVARVSIEGNAQRRVPVNVQSLCDEGERIQVEPRRVSQRGIVNRIMYELGPIRTTAPAFPLAASAIAPLRAKAESQGSGDFSPLWSGQNASGCKEIPAAQLTRELAAAF